jgi:putative cell wall-binding protein
MRKDNERRRRLVVTMGAIAVGAAVAFLPLMRADAAATVTRVSGADRYATAAAVSAQAFTPNVPVAYIATGTDFPDALAGAPAAAKLGGPVLLTQPNSLPSATTNELERLKPAKIIVLGGTSAVSAAIATQLAGYTVGTVTRISGADRYETAANVSAATFAANVNTVFVATGANFPDALSGGAAVANTPAGGGPLLLVQTGSIPQSTKTELTRLNAQKVVVLGGTSAVSEAVVTALDPYSVDPVVRRSGADRYFTSVEISKATFASAAKVYLATGANFPDALAAGSPAALAHGPVLLSQATCIPPAVNDEITRLNPDAIIVVGGESALSAAVLSRTVCTPQNSTSIPTFDTGMFCNGGTFTGGIPCTVPSAP